MTLEDWVKELMQWTLEVPITGRPSSFKNAPKCDFEDARMRVVSFSLTFEERVIWPLDAH